MKASEGRPGRVFVLRLEDGDIVPDCIEDFAAAKEIRHGYVILVGGMASGQVVCGPRETEKMPPEPVKLSLKDAHEVAGVGIIAPDKDGKPRLHIHASLGRGKEVLTGCLRPGVKTWLTGEVVIGEILG
ncbi:MAG: DNA-binding protein, partial [Dehalococcoidales bacterium]|nr:DNA-binding protein [Dehalococcoidales bacterium]